MRRLLVMLSAALACLAASAEPVEVSIPGADLSRGPGLMLKAYWFEAAVPEAAPAVVLMHGCGGLYDRRGALAAHWREYARLLNEMGMHALVVDSLTPRGETQNCTPKPRTRLITPAHRRLDAVSSLEWLAARSDVDASRLGLMGWSNGGTAVLAATNERRKEVAEADVKPAFAVAFYPSCDAELKIGFASQSRILLLLGEADDWTPPAACKRLAAQGAGKRIQVESYAGAPHGFDTASPVRARTDVTNVAHPGQPVHEGGQAAALKRSRARLAAFLTSVSTR